MVKRIVWSENAHEDKLGIMLYWNERLGSKSYSNKFNKTLNLIVRKLSRYPKLGKKLPGREARFLVKGFYQVVYLEKESSVFILQVWDSRRDPKTVLVFT